MNMKYFKYKHLLTLVGGLLILLTSCTKDLTDVTVVYENNFNNGNPKGIVTAGWLSDFAFGIFPFNKITNYKNQRMLGLSAPLFHMEDLDVCLLLQPTFTPFCHAPFSI